MALPLMAQVANRMLAVLALAAGLLVSPSAQAGWFTAVINRIQIGYDNSIIVYVNSSSNHECGSKRLDFSEPGSSGYRSMLAALLTYEVRRLPVQFNIWGCSGASAQFKYIESSSQED